MGTSLYQERWTFIGKKTCTEALLFINNLGIKNDKLGINYPLHNNKFDIDENGIYYGVVIQTLTLLKWLNKE